VLTAAILYEAPYGGTYEGILNDVCRRRCRRLPASVFTARPTFFGSVCGPRDAAVWPAYLLASAYCRLMLSSAANYEDRSRQRFVMEDIENIVRRNKRRRKA